MDELLYTQEDIDEWIRTCEELQEKTKEQEETIEELSKYKRLEEQGLLVRLPCKMGDEVTFMDRFCLNYGLYERAIKTGTIVEIGFTLTKEGRITWKYVIECYDRVFKENDIKSRYFCSQENLFISKEEAEKKLKELKGEE